MGNDLKALIISVVSLTMVGLGSVVAIVLVRPTEDNTYLINTVITILLPTLMSFVAAFKGMQNSAQLKDIKEQGNGATQAAIVQAAHVATLTEQVKSVQEAALLAAQTSKDTASALAAKEII
jgi:hypothetical protein